MRDGDHLKSKAHADAAAAAHIAANLHKAKPLAPPYLTPGATEVWNEVMEAVAADHFEPGDYRTLSAYCEACALVERLSGQLDTEAPVITDDDGVTKQNPFYRVYYSAVNSVQTFAVRLKLAPSTRTKDSAGSKRASRMLRAAGASARTGLMFRPRGQDDGQADGAEDEGEEQGGS